MNLTSAASELKILHRDPAWLALDKPSGLSVHNTEDGDNLLNRLVGRLQVESLFPVHRLDKETSGVQIIALNESSARELAQAFQSRTVKKIYCGVLRGVLKDKAGSWTLPLTDKAEGRDNPAGISAKRVPCETGFKVIDENRYVTLCEFNLITGRQHQIRKHAALMKHAILGDPRYGDRKYNSKIASVYGVQRMFLHCESIDIAGQHLTAPRPEIFGEVLSSGKNNEEKV